MKGMKTSVRCVYLSDCKSTFSGFHFSGFMMFHEPVWTNCKEQIHSVKLGRHTFWSFCRCTYAVKASQEDPKISEDEVLQELCPVTCMLEKQFSSVYLSFLLSPWKGFLFLDHYYIYYFVSHSKLFKNCVTLIWPRVTPLVGVASSGDSATDDLSANWSTEFDSLQTQKVHLQRQVSAHILLHLLVNMTHCRSRKCANLPAQQLIAVIGAEGKSICFAMSQGSAFASRYEFLTRTQSQLFRRNWVLTCFNLVPNSSPPCATKRVCLRQGSYKWKGFGVCVLLTWMTLQVLPVTCLMHDHDCITVYFACVLKGPLCACHENGEWSCCQDQKRHDTEFRQSWAPAMQNIKNASKSDRVCFPNNNLHSFASSAKLEHVSVVQRIAFCESQSSLHSASPWTGGLDDFNFGSSKWIQMEPNANANASDLQTIPWSVLVISRPW